MADQSQQTDQRSRPQKQNPAKGSGFKSTFARQQMRETNQEGLKWLFFVVATAVLLVVFRLAVQLMPLFQNDADLSRHDRLIERSSRFAYERFSMALTIDRGGKLEVHETASAIMPAGFSGFIRHAPRLIALEKDVGIAVTLSQAFFADNFAAAPASAEFLPAEFVETDAGYQIIAANPVAPALNADAPKQLQLIQFFTGAVGIGANGQEIFRWRLSPSEASVAHGVDFKITLPPLLGQGESKAIFYRSSALGDEPLDQKDLDIKIARADGAESQERWMIAGHYPKPLGRGEFLQVVLSWPRGYALTEGEVIQPLVAIQGDEVYDEE